MRQLFAKAIAATACTIAITSASPAHAERLFNWQGYNTILYDALTPPSERNVDDLIDRIETYLADTEQLDRRAAPGVHAHLGHLYKLRGDLDSARTQLEMEKRLFPESRVFVDQVLDSIAERP